MRYYPNYFDDFFNDTKKQDTSTVLRTDIYEKDGYYQICMEVCGIQKENIQIELKDGLLKESQQLVISTKKIRVYFVKKDLLELILVLSILVKATNKKISKLVLTMENYLSYCLQNL